MLPKEFENRMMRMLGDEYPAFLKALTENAAVRGMRLNTLKADESALSGFPYPTEKIGYAKDGYILATDEPVGTTPEHHAGIIYMQDPGAMASVCAVDIKEGDRVLDLCAAPGGKSGQAAARIGDGGFLLSNEYVPRRAKAMVGNFERLGIKCAIVTSLDTAEFKKLYKTFFDVVIADVPCSGEGMFRKNPEAVSEWSEQEVYACAARSLKILDNAAPLVKEGGRIVYSTCTFNTEENEEVVYAFLKSHPEYELIPATDEVRAATSRGIEVGEGDISLYECCRNYPHTSVGEGQFIAVLKRKTSNDMPTILYKGRERELGKTERNTVDAFLKTTLLGSVAAKPYMVGENIVLISHGVPVPPNSVFSAGVLLGEIRKGVLMPHHHFFSAYGSLFKLKVELDSEDKVKRYLRGEELEYNGEGGGWCAITYKGCTVGGGKISAGRIKNHYPKGLRNK